MGKINWGRVILGGILAGIVINVSEFLLNEVVLKAQIEAAMVEMGTSMEEASVAVWILWAFVAGIAAVWLYAAIRPRFGPGPGTAVKAGVAVWVLAYLLSTIATLNLGIFPQNLALIGLVWGLIEVVIATLAGAWAYREI